MKLNFKDFGIKVFKNSVEFAINVLVAIGLIFVLCLGFWGYGYIARNNPVSDNVELQLLKERNRELQAENVMLRIEILRIKNNRIINNNNNKEIKEIEVKK